MKRYVTHLVVAGCLCFLPGLALAVDYNGQWLGTITESIDNCKDLGKAEPGDYKLTVIHKGNEITVMENVVQRPYTGNINPEQPNLVHVQGSYSDDGGYVNELVNLSFVNDEAGNGQSIWHWSDGYFTCGGTFTFTLVKLRP